MGVSTFPAQKCRHRSTPNRRVDDVVGELHAPRCRRTKLLFWFAKEPQHKGLSPFLDRRFNRCLKADLASIPSCTKHHGVGSSDYQQNPRRGGPLGLATPIFSISLSSLEPKSLRIVILTIILVQVLCCHSITKITRNGINGAIFVTQRNIYFS